MSRALLQTINPSTQAVDLNGIINPGTVVRRFGCNCQLVGNGQQIAGDGYYLLTGTVTVEPTAAGTVTVGLFENGAAIPGTAVSGTAAAAEGPVTLPLLGVIRKGCCGGTSSVTAALIEGPGNVTGYNLVIQKL